MLKIIQSENTYWVFKRIDSRVHLLRYLSTLSCEPKELVVSQGELYVCLLLISAISHEVIHCIVLNVESYGEEVSIFDDSGVGIIAITTNSAVYTFTRQMDQIDSFRVYSPVSSIGYITSSCMLFVVEELCISFINQEGYRCYAYNTGFIENIELTDNGLKVYREHDDIYFIASRGQVICVNSHEKGILD